MLSVHYGCLLVMSLGLALSLSIPPRHQNNRAAYFLDNDPTGNYIIALKISPEDGTLSSPVRTSTAGTGLAGLVAISQDSVVVSKDVCDMAPYPLCLLLLGLTNYVIKGFLFTVNSQSNTVVMFKIDDEDPWHPKLVGSPAPTLGDTPVSVAYSRSLKTGMSTQPLISHIIADRFYSLRHQRRSNCWRDVLCRRRI